MIARVCPLVRPLASRVNRIEARVHGASLPVSATTFAHARCAR